MPMIVTDGVLLCDGIPVNAAFRFPVIQMDKI